MPEERGMGLRVSPDSRDNQYPVRLLLDPLIEKFFPRGLPGPYQHYNTGPVLNQGATGTCVGHGWTARMHDAPIMQKPTLSPFDLYRLFVKEDEWDDNDWEANTTNDSQLQSGTSVRAGAQVLRKLGLIKNFLWAREVEDLRAAHLAKFGGFVIGGPWTLRRNKGLARSREASRSSDSCDALQAIVGTELGTGRLLLDL
jgi:hypothetical protein